MRVLRVLSVPVPVSPTQCSFCWGWFWFWWKWFTSVNTVTESVPREKTGDGDLPLTAGELFATNKMTPRGSDGIPLALPTKSWRRLLVCVVREGLFLASLPGAGGSGCPLSRVPTVRTFLYLAPECQCGKCLCLTKLSLHLPINSTSTLEAGDLVPSSGVGLCLLGPKHRLPFRLRCPVPWAAASTSSAQFVFSALWFASTTGRGQFSCAWYKE